MNKAKYIRYTAQMWCCATVIAMTVTACGDDSASELSPIEKSSIEVSAQMNGGGVSAETRGKSATRADSYVAGTISDFSTNSKFNLAVYWNTSDPNVTTKKFEKVVSTTNSTSYPTGLYWDDFGGYNANIDMVGICVLDDNGNPTSATTPSVTFPEASVLIENRTISWSLSNAEGSQTYKGSEDLCVSGYLAGRKHSTQAKGGVFPIGYFTSSNSDNSETGNEFRHVLSKITVSLTPGEGYNDSFVGNPSVTINGVKRNVTVNLYNRTVKTNGDATNLTGNAVKAPSSSNYDVSFLAAPHVDYSGTDNFLEIEVPVANSQKNVYQVPIDKIADLFYTAAGEDNRTATGATLNTLFTLMPGVHYIINLTINKQKILVSAQLKAWTLLESAELIAPIVFEKDITDKDVSSTWDTSKDFAFYRAKSNGTYSSTVANTDYFNEGSKVYSYDTQEKVWVISTAFFWESYAQQYYFRALYPAETLTGTDPAPTTTVMALQAPKYNNTDIYWGTTAPYTWGSSNIAESYPVHPRTGTVAMNFYPIMSQIEVKIITTTDDNKVDLSKVATVTITGTAKTGNINLHNGIEPIVSTTASENNYNLKFKKSIMSADVTTSKIYGQNEVIINETTEYFDYVVPQILDNNAKIEINLKTGSGELKYSRLLNSITPEGSDVAIGEWKKGERYIYTLKIMKTGIEVSAKLVDWTKKEGNADVPFMP